MITEQGMLSDEHIALLKRQCGIASDLVQRANDLVPPACGAQIMEGDLPPEVLKLQRQSAELADALQKSAPIPLPIAAEFCKAQSKLADRARGLLAPVLQKHVAAVERTVERLRQTLMPRDVDAALARPAIDAVVGPMARQVECASKVQALRTVLGMLRDSAAQEYPRWLKSEIAKRDQLSESAKAFGRTVPE